MKNLVFMLWLLLFPLVIGVDEIVGKLILKKQYPDKAYLTLGHIIYFGVAILLYEG